MNSNSNIDSSKQNQDDFQLKKEKVPIKFNRKRESTRTQRKKGQEISMKNERICFISPDKVHLNLADNTKSPLYDKVDINFINFNTLRQQQYIIKSNTNIDNGNDSILSLYQELQDEGQRQKQLKMYQYIQIMESLYLELDSIKSENKKLTKKIKSLQSMEEFLMERQGFISDITDKNMDLNQRNIFLQNQKQKVSRQLNDFKKKYDKERDLFAKKKFQLQQQNELQKQEIQMIIEINFKMHEKLQDNKKIKKLKKTRRSQCNDNLSESRKKLIKSRSSEILLPNLFINNQNDVIDESDTRITNKFLSDRSENLDQSRLQYQKSKELQMSMMKARSMDGDWLFERIRKGNEQCDCSPKIKQFQQKIRYLEIEIDILKKIKFDTTKITEENARLKSQHSCSKQYNKKLLKKVESLTQKANNNQTKKLYKVLQKSNFSDSSLELSLSPNKKK